MNEPKHASFLRATGQAWKLTLSNWLMIGAGALLAWALLVDRLESRDADIWVLSAITLGIGSMVWFWASVKCPRCGTRWVWRMARTTSMGFYNVGLFLVERCPECGYAGQSGDTLAQ